MDGYVSFNFYNCFIFSCNIYELSSGRKMKHSKGQIKEEPMIKPEYIVCFGVGAALGAVITLIIVVLIRGAA